MYPHLRTLLTCTIPAGLLAASPLLLADPLDNNPIQLNVQQLNRTIETPVESLEKDVVEGNLPATAAGPIEEEAVSGAESGSPSAQMGAENQAGEKPAAHLYKRNQFGPN